jgi:hypothetical protein
MASYEIRSPPFAIHAIDKQGDAEELRIAYFAMNAKQPKRKESTLERNMPLIFCYASFAR